MSLLTPAFDTSAVEIGVIGRYQIDGPDEDASYGMFVNVQGSPIFLDIKDDDLVERRINHAKDLAASAEELSLSLTAFQERNSEFARKSIGSMGLHARDIEQVEVFWVPDGYTLLSGTTFLDP